MYFLVYAIFMCELHKIFLRDMMDNQCGNIFSTHPTVYRSHSIMFAFIERENIFFHVYPQLNFFLSLVCVSLFSPLPKFSPKQFFPKHVLFFLFLYGEKSFFNLCCSQRKLQLFIGGVASILYTARFFCFLDSLLLLTFVVYVFVYSLFEFSFV